MASREQLLCNVLLNNCDVILKRPEQFLGHQHQVEEDFKCYLKQWYDLTKENEVIKIPPAVALPSLVTDGFDDEQIWQELELQNIAYKNQCINLISKLVTSAKRNDDQLTLAGIGTANDEYEVNDPHIGNQSDSEVADSKESEDEDEDLTIISERGLAFDDADDVMSDISVELEKTLDKCIAFDKGIGVSDELSDGSSGKEEGDSDNEAEIMDDFDDSRTGEKVSKQRRTHSRCSVVDDKFFKLSELEQFLDGEDAKEVRRLKRNGPHAGEEGIEDDEEINYFEDIQSSGEEDCDVGDSLKRKRKSTRKLKYDAFFDPPLSPDDNDDLSRNDRFQNAGHHQGARDKDEEDEDVAAAITEMESADSDEKSAKHPSMLSSFERRQEKVREKIKLLEESNLSEKPWQLLGEASAAVRPENSLLQEHLQFDHMTRQAPLITEETNIKVENIIKQRIKDKAWDDVERKIKPKEDPFEYKKKIILDQEKSKLSLAEIYEQEYLKQQQNEKVREEEESEEHKAIRLAMSSLFVKLDALSNFHFVPKPVAPEVKIVNNLPAIVMEDVAPVGMSDAALLAPEEIKEKSKSELKGKSERTTTDKKHERRIKKGRQRKRQQFKLAQQNINILKSGLGNKYSKAAVMKQLTREGKVTIAEENVKEKKRRPLASSKDFFTKLQEEVQTSIQTKKSQQKKEKSGVQLSADKLKL